MYATLSPVYGDILANIPNPDGSVTSIPVIPNPRNEELMKEGEIVEIESIYNNGKTVHCSVVKANLSRQKEKELAEALINQDLFDKDICKTRCMDSFIYVLIDYTEDGVRFYYPIVKTDGVALLPIKNNIVNGNYGQIHSVLNFIMMWVYGERFSDRGRIIENFYSFLSFDISKSKRYDDFGYFIASMVDNSKFVKNVIVPAGGGLTKLVMNGEEEISVDTEFMKELIAANIVHAYYIVDSKVSVLTLNLSDMRKFISMVNTERKLYMLWDVFREVNRRANHILEG